VKYKNETNLSIRIPVAREFPPSSNMLAGIFFVNLALKREKPRWNSLFRKNYIA